VLVDQEDIMPTFATLVTSLGDIKVRLLTETAPDTVENFVGLATGSKQWTDPTSGEKKSEPLYNGTVFHRVIPNFMIQGGDPLGTGTGGPGYKFHDEVDAGPKFDGPGYLAMANAGPNTNGSQFFVTVAPTPHLTGRHTIFGIVEEGQDVADAISKVGTDGRDRPHEDIVLNEVRIQEG
jgi:peptidyl-prolyl cis-trans isomerase A (cyclophilin A)